MEVRERMARTLISASLVSLAALLVAGCGGDGPPTPAAQATATAPGAEPGDAETGERLFLTAGCATCHGSEGEGAAAGPSLVGHTEAQVLRQVRNPIGTMPRFGPERVSDQELAHIAAFLVGLEGEHGHATVLPADDLALMHLRMALLAVKTDDAAEARHHLTHALEGADASVTGTVQHALASMEGGDLHEAEHEIEELIGGQAGDDDTFDLHLSLAAAGLQAADRADALHHLEHFMALETVQARLDQAAEVVEHLEAGKLAEAAHALEALTEGAEHPHGD